MAPQPGEKWKDMDPRHNARIVTILAIEGEYAVVQRADEHVDRKWPTTRVALARFHDKPIKRGYTKV